jgi:hypothetical protein
VVCAFLLAFARPLSLVWLFALLLVLVWPLPRTVPGRSARPSGPARLTGRIPVAVAPRAVPAGVLLAVVGSGVWLVWMAQNRAGQTVSELARQWEELAVSTRIVLIVLKFGDMVQQAVSQFGWLDVPWPQLALVLWLVLVGGVTVMWWMSRSAAEVPRSLAPVVLVVGLAAVVAHSWLEVFGWQGRYVIPLVAGVAVLLVPGMSRGYPASSPRVPVLVMALLAVVLHTGAVVWVFGRFAYGLQDLVLRFPSLPLPRTSEWTAYGGGESLTALAVTAGVLGAAAVTLAWLERRTSPPSPVDVAGTIQEAPSLPPPPSVVEVGSVDYASRSSSSSR